MKSSRHVEQTRPRRCLGAGCGEAAGRHGARGGDLQVGSLSLGLGAGTGTAVGLPLRQPEPCWCPWQASAVLQCLLPGFLEELLGSHARRYFSYAGAARVQRCPD